jgi:hypothetical protein
MGRETGSLHLLTPLLLTGGKGADLVIRGNVVLNTLSSRSTSTLLRDQICINSPSSRQVLRPSRTVLRDRLRFSLYTDERYVISRLPCRIIDRPDLKPALVESNERFLAYVVPRTVPRKPPPPAGLLLVVWRLKHARSMVPSREAARASQPLTSARSCAAPSSPARSSQSRRAGPCQRHIASEAPVPGVDAARMRSWRRSLRIGTVAS